MDRIQPGAVTRALASGPEGHATGPFLVGFSGGMDSTVLLHALARTHPGRVRAIHVHHGLQPDADHWERHCERFCAKLGIPLHVEHVQVVDVDVGPEAAARAARHAAFERVLRDGETLVLAHHRDDQAETLLLRALRGSGPDGLAAMRPLRTFAHGLLWRPLLALSRKMLRDHAVHHALGWIEDPSNASIDVDRNFLRQEVMPLLRQRWPGADAAFSRVAALQADALTLLQQADAEAAFNTEIVPLPLACLRALPRAARARALRGWVLAQGLPEAPARLVSWVEDELAIAPADRAAECRWAGAALLRWRDALHIDDGIAPLPADFRTVWDGRQPLQLPNGVVLGLIGAPAFEESIQLHARQGGERIRLPGRQHHHDLKRALQAAGIPPWRRAALPLLSDARGQVLAAGDLLSAPLAEWLARHRARLSYGTD